MSDTGQERPLDGDEEQPEERVTVEELQERLERTRLLQRENTESLRRLWTAGDVPQLPCVDNCSGEIRVNVKGLMVTGHCPSFMEGNCLLKTKADRELHHRMSLAGFGVRYHDPDPEQIRGREGIDAYVEKLGENIDGGRGLLIAGDLGVGKTMALGYVARQMIASDHGVWAVTMTRFIDMLHDPNTRRRTTRRALGVEVLMWDDFGSGEMTAWVLGIVEGIVEHRYARRMPLLLTTNLTREGLLGEPLFRRMVDRWRQTNAFVNMGGSSKRHE